MAVFPDMPAGLRGFFPDAFWTGWWQPFKSFILSGFNTKGDVELTVAGKGIILVSPSGDKFKITISDAGTTVISPVP